MAKNNFPDTAASHPRKRQTCTGLPDWVHCISGIFTVCPDITSNKKHPETRSGFPDVNFNAEKEGFEPGNAIQKY